MQRRNQRDHEREPAGDEARNFDRADRMFVHAAEPHDADGVEQRRENERNDHARIEGPPVAQFIEICGTSGMREEQRHVRHGSMMNIAISCAIVTSANTPAVMKPTCAIKWRAALSLLISRRASRKQPPISASVARPQMMSTMLCFASHAE